MTTLSTPLVPRVPGGPLRVLIFGRTTHRAESLVDQFILCETFLRKAYRDPTEVRHLGDQSIHDVEAAVASGEWDLLLLEDLTRVHRDPRLVHALVEHAVGHGTRVVAPRDHVDSAAP